MCFSSALKIRLFTCSFSVIYHIVVGIYIKREFSVNYSVFFLLVTSNDEVRIARSHWF